MNRKKKRGFSFIEVFVTLVIAVFFMGVVYFLWNRGIFFINRGSHFIQMQRGARFIMEYLHDDMDQIAHFKTGKAHTYDIRSGANEIEFWRYSEKDEKPGRPELLKIKYHLENGRLVRSEYDQKGKLRQTKKFGQDFVEAIYEPYFMKIGPINSSMNRRWFLRVELKGQFEIPNLHTKQQLHITGSFAMKTPNGHYKDLFYIHNPISVRENP